MNEFLILVIEVLGDLWENIHVRRSVFGGGLVGGMILLLWSYQYAPGFFLGLILAIMIYAVGAAAVAMWEG